MPVPPFETPTELIRACCAGDPQAWNEFVARYIRLIASVARRRGFDSDDVADICQDVLLDVFCGLQKLEQPESLVGWLITITYRTCITWLRNQRTSDNLPLDEGIHPEFDGIHAADVRMDVTRALNQLAPRSRDLLAALYLDGDSVKYRVVAQELQIPIGSIGPKRARSFKRLRQEFDTPSQATLA